MILDGKLVSGVIRQKLRKEIESLEAKIKLIVILVGDNSASKIYVRQKQKACAEVGIICEVISLDKDVCESEIIEIINEANQDDLVHGIIIQLPLPKHLDANKLINYIDPHKDVDGLTITNQGKLLNNLQTIIPATPKGVLNLLQYYQIDIEGKNALVIGRSNLVGKPLALLLLHQNATVTIAHSKTKALFSENYDIVVSCVGKPNFIIKEMIKPGAIVVDVGISHVDGKVVGDVKFDEVKERASYLTPVPGGVGPMTIASLLENIVTCYKINKGIL